MSGFFSTIKKFSYILKTRGIRGIRNAIDTSYKSVNPIEYYSWITDDEPIELDENQKAENGDQMTANWIIPDLTKGSGGHMTILRFVSLLEGMGLHNRVYLFESNRFKDDKDLRDYLAKYFIPSLKESDIEIYSSTDNVKYAQATIATGWQTAYFVKRFNNTEKKYYFVQDYEPEFYGLGAKSVFAENTYSFGFKGITAGDWLKKKLKNEFNMEADSFSFAVDKNIYYHRNKRDNKRRILFYARPTTERRAFELGLLALNEIHKISNDIEIVLAGYDVSNMVIPFEYKNLGLLSPEQLADAYSQSDVCIVLSLSNLSLLPLEIMACNSVCATGYGENNEWLVNEDNAILFKNEPRDIADKVLMHLDDPEKMKSLRLNGMTTAATTSWEAEAKKVYSYIVE